MEKRFFYKDPIAAAWMAKHFGMKFEGWYWNNEQFVFENDDVDLEDTTLYIHAESLGLLEPKAKDLVFYGYGVYPHSGEAWDEVRAILKPDNELYPTLGDDGDYMLLDGGDHRSIERLNRIIQRDGKAFFWPELEV